MGQQLKPIPKFATEAEERAFWESHDSTDYIDWSRGRNVSFPNLRPSTPPTKSASKNNLTHPTPR
jgi:hypothetical protein